MNQEDFFNQFLKEEYDKVMLKMRTDGFDKLTQEDRQVMLLQLNTNHIHHLELDLKQGLKSVRGEIKEVYEKIDTELKEVNEKIDTGLKKVNEKIDTGLKEVNEKMDTGLKEVNEKMDIGLKEVNEKMDTGLKEVNEKMDKQNDRIYDLQKTLTSQTWKIILAMGFMLSFFRFTEGFFS